MREFAPMQPLRGPVEGELSVVPAPLAWLALTASVLLFAAAIGLSGRPGIALVVVLGFFAVALVNLIDRLLSPGGGAHP